MDRIAQGGHRPRRRPSARTSCSRAWSSSPAAPARTCRSSRPPNTSTPSRRTLEAKIARRRRDGMAHPLDHPLERAGDGRARQPQARRPRRPHRVASPRRPRCTTSASTTSGARPSADHPGDLLYIQGHSSPGIYARSLPRRPHQRIAARQLPHGSRRPRHQLLPASVADARLLADADRVAWAWARSPRSTRRASGSTSKAAA